VRLELHPEARAELRSAALWYDERRPGLGDEFIAEMKRHGIACDDVQNQGYGRLTKLTLPGGGKIGVYQPRHARPVSGIKLVRDTVANSLSINFKAL
jgi:hypothetical protein